MSEGVILQFIWECVDVFRGKIYPRSRITGEVAYFVYIVFIACDTAFDTKTVKQRSSLDGTERDRSL